MLAFWAAMTSSCIGDEQCHHVWCLTAQEMAVILDSATDRSLVLIDELGRATSTTDGVVSRQMLPITTT